MSEKTKTKIGIIGCGAIGTEVALFIDRALGSHAFVEALADKDEQKAENVRGKLTHKPTVLGNEALVKTVDLVIEAASQQCAQSVLRKALQFRKDVVILSVGALIKDFSLFEQALKAGITIYVPSGAICGIDGIGALALGAIERISLITSKPPRGLRGATYLLERKIDVDNLKEEKVIFEGEVKEAIKYFPKNINVAAALLLASSLSLSDAPQRPAEISVCIKADPSLARNVHRIVIEAQEARVSVEVENVPSKLNPKTSTLTILSTQLLLKKIFSSFKIGS